MPDIFDQIPDAKNNDIFASLPDAKQEVSKYIKGGVLDPTLDWKQKLDYLLSGNPKQATDPDLVDVPVLRHLGEFIKNKGINTGNYWMGAGGSIANDILDAISKGPILPGKLGALKDIVPGEIERVPHIQQPLALPPARTLAEREFIGGDTGQVVPAQEAIQDPRKYSQVFSSEGAQAPSFDLGQVQESSRLANLQFGSAEQYPGSRLSLPNTEPAIPPESGDIRGGFNPQTNSEMQYPYNVVPERFRPRATQSEILSRTGIKGVDFDNTPQLGARFTPNSMGVSAADLSAPGPDVSNNPFVGPRNFEPTPDIALGSGKPAELLAPNSRIPASEIFDDMPKQKLDEVNSQPRIAQTPEDINKIPPGQADVPPTAIDNGKGGITPFRAETSSPHIVMKNFPASQEVIQPIMRASDEKIKWLATTEREFSSIAEGLNKDADKALFHLINGEEPGSLIDGSNIDLPTLKQKAEQVKKLTDSVFSMAEDKNPEMGFIDRYATHIARQPEGFVESAKSIISHHLGTESPLYNVLFNKGKMEAPTGKVGDLYEYGMGKPSSVFTEPRTGALQDIETRYSRIMPVYLESIAKTIFDKSAVEEATSALKNIPEGKLKEYLQGYIKNYTRYDADPQLASAWNGLANQIATINARSVISFNPLVHMYHAGQLPANIWPELGTKYSMLGMKEFASHPIQSYQELARNGLFSNMIRPMRFQTPMQKFDSVSYFMNIVESVVKGTGYYGFKARALAEGLPESEATMRAIAETKDATATVDPARSMRYFTPESNVAGGQMARLGKQYHQIPMKLIEQFSSAMAEMKDNPAKAARYIAGSSVAAAGSAIGLHTLHVNPLNLTKYALGGAGQFGTVMLSVARSLAKGDLGSALTDVAEWATPSGTSMKKGAKLLAGEE